jgi:uncharacterized RDD family membrane protein YckC
MSGEVTGPTDDGGTADDAVAGESGVTTEAARTEAGRVEVRVHRRGGSAFEPVTVLGGMPTTVKPPPVGRQGNYAGAVTRLVAFAVDVGATWGIFTLTLAGISFAVQLVTGTTLNLSSRPLLTTVAYAVWGFVYFAYQWALGGKTIGMAILGIRVVAADGLPASPRQAILRTLFFPLSFLLFGLGFLGILLNKDRHALHDRLARTVVVYSWDARAARLRWLARQEPTAAR